jgi:hypothetical protein
MELTLLHSQQLNLLQQNYEDQIKDLLAQVNQVEQQRELDAREYARKFKEFESRMMTEPSLQREPTENLEMIEESISAADALPEVSELGRVSNILNSDWLSASPAHAQSEEEINMPANDLTSNIGRGSMRLSPIDNDQVSSNLESIPTTIESEKSKELTKIHIKQPSKPKNYVIKGKMPSYDTTPFKLNVSDFV